MMFKMKFTRMIAVILAKLLMDRWNKESKYSKFEFVLLKEVFVEDLADHALVFSGPQLKTTNSALFLL